jgi:hypothetical protein
MPNSGVKDDNKASAEQQPSGKVKFEIYGEEMIEKKVRREHVFSGRLYLPPSWVDRRVKIIKID